jgi:hypothetical protein
MTTENDLVGKKIRTRHTLWTIKEHRTDGRWLIVDRDISVVMDVEELNYLIGLYGLVEE